MYDAIVVGARCAGSPVAMLLARKGYRVLLVDKARFPSDIMSTHYIHPPGVARLALWGLLDSVIATNCPPIFGSKMHFGDFVMSAPRAAQAGPPALCPRRYLLDKILVDGAVEAGTELRERFTVRELVWEDGAVVGVRGGRSGEEVEERARVVIGADGMHSVVARSVRAPEYNTRPSLTCAYYSYWEDVPLEEAEFFILEGGGILAFPTNDQRSCLAVGWPRAMFPEVRKDIEGSYLRVLLSSGLAERVRRGRRVERFVGTGDVRNFFRRPYGPGWALVGDAGYHRDPVTGLGITDAFRDADLLVEALDAGLSGRRPLAEALAGYESTRNEIAAPLYEVTCRLAGGEAASMEAWMAFGAAMARS
jgi:flavin-dependent dehydrogenase